jgi:protoheme IX farnesyltransferase
LSLPHIPFSYIEVLKPKETSLICLISMCAAIAAAGGSPELNTFMATLAAIALGSGGCNGLTNYLDRKVDARMERTKHRPLPAKRIDSPEKALWWSLSLIALGLILAFLIHPFCFIAGLLGSIASAIWRKKVVCPLLGAIASSAPIAIGWLAFSPQVSPSLISLCGLIWVWVPLHVWSVMIAHRKDYLGGGISYFPLSWDDKDGVKVLLGLSLLLCITSIIFYFMADLSHLYLGVAIALGALMVGANINLVASTSSPNAFRVYKLTAFPYLGIIFLAICADVLLV